MRKGKELMDWYKRKEGKERKRKDEEIKDN